MRRVAFLLPLLLLVAIPARAAAPVAVAKAPATVRVGTVVRIDTAGMVSDSGPLVRVWSGPDWGEAHYNSTGQLIGFELSRPGTYTFISVASGKAPDNSALYAATFVATTVTGDAPTPVPGPGPTPPPVPPTPPPVVPVPQSIRLTAVAVYSGDTASAAEGEFAAVRDSLTLTGALAALNVDWHVMDRADPRLGPKSLTNPNGCNIGQYLAPVGPDPQIIVYDTGNTPNSLYDAAGARLGQKAPASFDAPRTETETLAMFRRMRGLAP